MPNRIRILPDEIANRIAAGEAVERPASVVKELTENAIDAGADRIVIEIASAGKETIRISDNGSGMSQDDTLLSLERHATSKITELKDLGKLCTLGFRGEALPSIAAVSRMVIETKQEEGLEGSRVVVEGGRVRDVSSTGRARGTTIIVHGLFFNVPARRKFLKGTDTELRHVVNAVTGLALAYPKISFVLSHNTRQILNLERSERKNRVKAVFGQHFGEDAIFVERGGDGVDIWGFIGRPESAKKSGAHQTLVVNGRWVQHKGITFAIQDGYGGLLTKGFQPVFSFFLDVDPSRLDVNVHPTKREVRFADQRAVYRSVAEAVRQALRKEDMIPEVKLGSLEPAAMPQELSATDITVNSPIIPRSQTGMVADKPIDIEQDLYFSRSTSLDLDRQMPLPLNVRRSETVLEVSDSPAGKDLGEDAGQVSVWQVHERYILAHIKNGIIIVDQQIAHERVIYENVLASFQGTPNAGQRLLFPLTLDFGLKEIQVVRDAIPLLSHMGFGVRDFGGNTVVADAIPVDLIVWAEGMLLREIVGDLLERENEASIPVGEGETISPLEHSLAISYARHTAIKSGEILSIQEMQALIDQLFATQEPFVCPQGKPTVVKMPLDEIDQRFGR
ncbi:MAG TPA: DNA mismatch repair endonuclease MutL [Candidatus Latescibacteria bacterium]|nr:DNA mismatch repair endonuclease MutL [Candidatus Latescibacterota bacterium]